jgi:hypothetical protein
MHYVGKEQHHGFENRLTSDIYPADFGWTPNWDEPDERQEWYHNMSSVLQAGPAARTNQLDYDEEVIHKVGSHYDTPFQLLCASYRQVEALVVYMFL